MRVSMVKWAEVAAASCMVAALALGGCAGSSQPSSSAAGASSASESVSSSSSEPSESSASSESVEAAADVVFGDESSDAAPVTLANETGSAIEGVAVAVANSGEEPVSLAADGGTWADGDTAAVYLGPEGSAYDVTLTIADAAYVLHGLDAEAVGEAEVRLDGSLAYLAYEVGGNPVSTLQDEADIAAAEQAAAEAAEAEAAEAAEAEYVYDDASAAQPAQSEDACIDGGVVLR